MRNSLLVAVLVVGMGLTGCAASPTLPPPAPASNQLQATDQAADQPLQAPSNAVYDLQGTKKPPATKPPVAKPPVAKPPVPKPPVKKPPVVKGPVFKALALQPLVVRPPMPDPIMFLTGMVMATTAKGSAAGHSCTKLMAVMGELQSEKAKGLAIGKTLGAKEPARRQALARVMGMIASEMKTITLATKVCM